MDKLKEIKEILNETIHVCSSRKVPGEDYHEIKTSQLKWLIEQAENLEKIRETFYAEDTNVVDGYRKIIEVFEGKEKPTRNIRK